MGAHVDKKLLTIWVLITLFGIVDYFSYLSSAIPTF